MPDAPIDPPLTPEEIAESRRIAGEYFKLIEDALVGAPKPARRSKKWRPRSRPLAPSELGHANSLLPTLAMRYTLFCKRGACRRAGRCRFGERRGDAAGAANPHGAAPCFERLPEVVQFVFPYAVFRRFEPQHFRDEITLRCEKAWVDAARGRIAAAAAACEAQSEGGADAASDAAPPPPRQTEFPEPPAPRPRLTQL
ncbi:hypothetical protein GTW51_02770 [Aurantimonas aggregata]|uniref:Uncharacterized protein n=1 Tax=Aurantimonas aggregata TaxID=2047720 RepID=A0A6L9MDA7_9HYPH|nr:hypothetical protein [Aurantimonas aggregata]NDV85616.1 hypothetical protein [Aurantimonas aggregata]